MSWYDKSKVDFFWKEQMFYLFDNVGKIEVQSLEIRLEHFLKEMWVVKSVMS